MKCGNKEIDTNFSFRKLLIFQWVIVILLRRYVFVRKMKVKRSKK